jgi:hypothetical protein
MKVINAAVFRTSGWCTIMLGGNTTQKRTFTTFLLRIGIAVQNCTARHKISASILWVSCQDWSWELGMLCGSMRDVTGSLSGCLIYDFFETLDFSALHARGRNT